MFFFFFTSDQVAYYSKIMLDPMLAAKHNTADFNTAMLNYFTKTDITNNYYDKTAIDSRITAVTVDGTALNPKLSYDTVPATKFGVPFINIGTK